MYFAISPLLLISLFLLSTIVINRKLKNQKENIAIFFIILSISLANILLWDFNFGLKIVIKTFLFAILMFILFEEYFSLTKKEIVTVLIGLVSGICISYISMNNLLTENILYAIITLWILYISIFLFYKMINFHIRQPSKINIKRLGSIFSFLLIILFIILEVAFFENVTTFFSQNFNSILPVFIIVKSLNIFIIYTITSIIIYSKIYQKEKVKILTELDKKSAYSVEFQILNNIKDMVIKSDKLDSTLDKILNIGCSITRANGGIIYLFDDEKGFYYVKNLFGYVNPLFFVNSKVFENQNTVVKKIMSTNIEADTGVFKTAVDSAAPLYIKKFSDMAGREHLKYLRDYETNIGSIMIGKLMSNDKLIGIAYLEKTDADFNENDFEVFQTILKISDVLIANVESRLLEKETQRLANEMVIAEQIQTGILPKEINIEGYSICAHMKTASEVGGDYYDIINANDGRFWISIGDVTGHGVTAGLIMMMLETATATCINTKKNITPRDLTINCNKIIYENVKNRLLLDQFVTSCAIVGNKDGEFEFSGAHLDILIYRSKTGKVERLVTNGMWLGLIENISAHTDIQKFKLEKDDTMMVYTDGVIEIKDKKDEQYDIGRLVSYFENNGNKDVNSIRDGLNSALDSYKYRQDDDISFVILKKL